MEIVSVCLWTPTGCLQRNINIKQWNFLFAFFHSSEKINNLVNKAFPDNRIEHNHLLWII